MMYGEECLPESCPGLDQLMDGQVSAGNEQFSIYKPWSSCLVYLGGGGEGEGGRTFHAADELAMELDGLDGLMDGL